jgi:hypothetical protein
MYFMIYDTAHLDKGCFYSGLAKRKKNCVERPARLRAVVYRGKQFNTDMGRC